MSEPSWTDPAAILTAANVGVTVIYTFVTTLIWRATSKATKATWRAVEAGQRPYLGITSCEFMRPQNHASPLYVSLVLKNAGSVPARRISIGISLVVADEKHEVERESNLQFTLFPGETSTMKFQLPEQHHQSYSSSDGGGLVVASSIAYQGITDQSYASHSTYSYSGFQNGFRIAAGHFD